MLDAAAELCGAKEEKTEKTVDQAKILRRQRRAQQRRQLSFEKHVNDRDYQYFFNPDPEYEVSCWLLPEGGVVVQSVADLSVEIYAAEGLKNPIMFSTMKPSVFGYLGKNERSAEKSFETPKAKDTDPVWNSRHKLVWTGETSLHLEVQAASMFQSAAAVGLASVDLSQVHVDGPSREYSIPLHPQGRMHLKAQIISRDRRAPPLKAILWRNMGDTTDVWPEPSVTLDKSARINRIREGQCFNVIGKPSLIDGHLWFRLAWGLPAYDKSFSIGGAGQGWVCDEDAVSERSVRFAWQGDPPEHSGPATKSAGVLPEDTDSETEGQEEAEDEAEEKAAKEFKHACKLVDLFQQLDQDRSGSLDEEQFATFLDLLGMRTRDAHRLFQAADTNEDGNVDYAEFIAWIFYSTNDTGRRLGSLASQRARTHIPKKGEVIGCVAGVPCTRLLLRPDGSFSFVHKDVYRFCAGVQGSYTRAEAAGGAVALTLVPGFFGPRVHEYFLDKCPPMEPLTIKMPSWPENGAAGTLVELDVDELPEVTWLYSRSVLVGSPNPRIAITT